MIEWKTFALGALETNAFVATKPSSNECVVFDCPDTPDAMIEWMRRRALRPTRLFLTHAHGDHMGGVQDLRAAFPEVRVVQHPLEADWLSDAQLNLSAFIGTPFFADRAEEFVEEGTELTVLGERVVVYHLPGHSPGSVAFHFVNDRSIVSGDVLFRSGVGRWDFPNCSADDLRRSLERMQLFPDETRVFPGHGGSTTIGKEKSSNPYLRNLDLIRD